MDLQFKSFLLNENQAYLGERLGDILNALQDLEENGKSMGVRQLVKNSEQIVNQIRRILHTHWSDRETEQLKILQRIGVAISKAIDEKDDLNTILPSAAEEVEKLLGDIGMPVNKLASPENAEQPQESPEEAKEEAGTAPPQGKS